MYEALDSLYAAVTEVVEGATRRARRYISVPIPKRATCASSAKYGEQCP
jgi:hypothetical protein